MTSGGDLESVRHLAKSFRAGVSIRAALDHTVKKYGSLAWDTSAAQKYLLDETILYHPELHSYVSSFTFGKRRCKRFIRLVMDEVDRVGDVELDDNFGELAAWLCESESCSHEEFSYIVLELPSSKGKTGFRNFVGRVSCCFNDLGERVWEAGVYLCAQLADARWDVRKGFEGGRILELGAGTGVSAGAYADVDVNYALLTDDDVRVVWNIEHNINLKGFGSDFIETEMLDATDCEEVLNVANNKKIDRVVAADMTYDKHLMMGVVKTFKVVLSENRIGFLVVTHRNERRTQLLWERIEEGGILKLELVQSGQLTEMFDYLVGWDFESVNALL